MTLDSGWLSMLVFLSTSGLILAFFIWRNWDLWHTQSRMRGLTPLARERPFQEGRLHRLLTLLHPVGTPLLPSNEAQRTQLQQRLIFAGIYDRKALAVLLGVKMMLMGLALVVSLCLAVSHSLTPMHSVLAGVIGVAVAMIAPGIWLDYLKGQRQAVLRRALPDALDMLVLCVEGGVSLASAMQRVTAELHTAHPVLGVEWDLIQREMMLGTSVGEGLKKLAIRTDLEDIHNLAAVILQSERYGTSVVKSLRIHAETLRQQRQQRAEEQAQKAAVKILFPTLLCIFPAVFIVILGPAAFQIMAILQKMK
jgi:tight adherence protein C